MAKSKRKAAEAWRYVLKEDRELPPEQQSTFVLRPMTMIEQAAYFDAYRSGGGDGDTVWKGTVQLAVDHIANVENFPTDAPKEWPKDRTGQMAYLDEIGVDACFEIGNEVFRRSYIGDEEKN